MRDAIRADDRLEWERGLFEAFASRDVRTRDALVSEQLVDLDGLVQRWARVPRVSASVATSAGLLFALLALLKGLAVAGAEDASAFQEAFAAAVGALTLGVAGASFCIAVHVRSSRVLRARLTATARLIARLEALSVGDL